MERYVFAALLTLSLATPAAVFVFSDEMRPSRQIPAMQKMRPSADDPEARARVEAYLTEARRLLHRDDAQARRRACDILAQASRNGAVAADEMRAQYCPPS